MLTEEAELLTQSKISNSKANLTIKSQQEKNDKKALILQSGIFRADLFRKDKTRTSKPKIKPLTCKQFTLTEVYLRFKIISRSNLIKGVEKWQDINLKTK